MKNIQLVYVFVMYNSITLTIKLRLVLLMAIQRF